MASTLETNRVSLAPGLRLRAAAWDDVDAVAKLILDVCTADGDATVAAPPEELRREWQVESFTLETDAWVVEGPDGGILGYEEFFNRHAHAAFWGDGYVHPDFLGQGIGTALLRALDRRALEVMQLAPSDLRAYIRNGLSAGDVRGRELHETAGYQAIRYSWRMEIHLPDTLEETAWPAGIHLRPFDLEEHNRLVFEAHEEAFSDHWGHVPGIFTRWQQHMTGSESFDPSLWFIAWDGEQIAGYSLCRFRSEIGWVGTLGVRRAWRKRGLGMALLQHSFREFHRRGMRTVTLQVDASSPTGATRLYEKAGMRIAAEYVIYEKEYRPGREFDEDPERQEE